eukprot:359990-Chlamydomonas_euryale.AAC.7
MRAVRKLPFAQALSDRYLLGSDAPTVTRVGPRRAAGSRRQAKHPSWMRKVVEAANKEQSQKRRVAARLAP